MSHELTILQARGFRARLRGLMLTRPLPPGQALLIPRCASVHTFFMRYALDLVYLDAHGTIVRLQRHVRPWRLSWGGAGARQVVEMTAGGIDRLGLQAGACMAIPPSALAPPVVGRQRGAALVEFVLVGPLITVLGLAVLQYSLLFFVKGQVNHAAFMAARAGSVAHASIDSIRTAYQRALIPVYGGGQSSAELAAAYARAQADLTPQTFRIEILNPTQQSFDDYATDAALNAQYNARAIPNAGLALRPGLNTVASNSGQTLQDANLLRLRITHGYEPKVWLMRLLYQKYQQWLDTGQDSFHTQLIGMGRIPLVTHVTLAMQTDAVEQTDSQGQSLMASSPGPGNAGQPMDPGDPSLSRDPVPQCQTMGCTVSPSGPGAGVGGVCSGAS